MDINKIVASVNRKLAGEILTFSSLSMHLDAVIDDINNQLDSTFPTFSEFTQAAYPEKYPNYDFFPDKYIRGTVIVGAAYKFYVTDEEGNASAEQYGYDYREGLFLMLRDYLELVPEEFQAGNTGSVVMSFASAVPSVMRGDF